MRPDTLAVLWFCAAAIICAPFTGQFWRTVAQVKARRLAEEERICVPLPVEVAPELGYDGRHLGRRWPPRLTPSDTAAADEPPWFTPTEYVTRRCVPPHEIARHVSDEYGTGKITYVGKHCWPTEVTAEFERIVRTVVFDEELAEVAS